ncbi:HAD family hydrolase, partial [Escherichia coli]|nr:HAD family hydrolase [Escherichia coli]
GRVDTVVLDKTGTVTTGRMSLLAVTPGEGERRDEVLRVAAALESGSEHPIAQAVVAGAAEVGAPLPVTNCANVAGMGVTGTV